MFVLMCTTISFYYVHSHNEVILLVLWYKNFHQSLLSCSNTPHICSQLGISVELLRDSKGRKKTWWEQHDRIYTDGDFPNVAKF